jgi:DNA repair exonuclease SbcCD ATPase subunit
MATASIAKSETATATLEELQRVVAAFRVKYPQSQNIKSDLESFLSQLDSLAEDRDEMINKIEQAEDHDEMMKKIEQHVSRIEGLLEIRSVDGELIEDRLQKIGNNLDDAKTESTEDLADAMKDLLNRCVLIGPDVDLRKKIEALVAELARYEGTTSFEEKAKARIVCV